MPKKSTPWDADHPLSPADATRLLTRVRVQCDLPDGPTGCWLWKGCTTNKGRPHMNFLSRPVGVRPAVYEAHNGFAPPPGMWVVACDDPACVSPHCVRALPRRVVQRAAAKTGSYSRPDAVRKRTLAIRSKSRFSDALIEQARTMPGNNAEVGRALGMSKTHVRLVRLRTLRAPMQGHWVGLGARTAHTGGAA